jgi:hypothetical protein
MGVTYSLQIEWYGMVREFYGLTDYPEVIKKPMDLGTIKVTIQPLPPSFASHSSFLSFILCCHVHSFNDVVVMLM